MVAQSAQHELSSPAAEPASRTTDAASSDAGTTFIIHNLPSYFDQTSGMSWLDNSGYACLYDFFLMFPKNKRASNPRYYNRGYALVNFRCKSVAERFLQSFDDTKVCEGDSNEIEEGEDINLYIRFANVQGFVRNYERFSAICDDPHTLCAPFFASDSIWKHGLTKGVQKETTIVIRNLPTFIDTQDKARQWLDDLGYAKKYDFLFYFPWKTTLKNVKTRNSYMFVNFTESVEARACTSDLHGMPTCKSMPKLNVVSSRVQGLEGCKMHFRFCDAQWKPWIDEAIASTPRSSEESSFRSFDEP
eukprot:TRINITY_DN12516_c1_g2_i2.p1 TRINITY_DN12516_c1_g2~~TRINITY_DN12516_c1_g2_i2.p1  ORF type:complete len:303 (-),score=23.27 TRINITY_DN12516_c1_g2_i2:101-1009(-)